ncbi:hypothetical protein HG452_002765 [Candidatus Saccharibacteria bacterium]|nr:hypothetical protein [Candidatus Saccharibacteria bacterium]
MEKDKFAEPLARETKLKKLEEDYTIILYKIIRHIIKELGQSAERQTIPFDYFNHWRKYSTKISIPKETAIEFGYGNDKFIEVRGTVNRKFHIYEDYEAEKDGTKQIFFLIEPELILEPDKPSQNNGKVNIYHEAILKEIKKHLRKLPKDEYDDLCEKIRIDKMIEIPIVLPDNIHPSSLYRYIKRQKAVFKNITGFRRPHADSEARKNGYNLYVQVTGLDF